MKVKALSAVAAVSLLGLSACTQQSAAPQNTANSSKTYYVKTPKQTPKPQQVVFQQQRRAPTYKQSVSQQQVRRPVVQQPRVVVKPAQPSQNARQQAELSELYGIGDQIFKNETGGRIDQLVHWNLREDFAAMGIGHFTWYPSGRSQRFGNTFPGLLDYLQKNGVQLPAWVQRARFEGAPWRNRAQLMAAKNSPEIKQFSQLLYNTRHLQAKYIMDRAMRAMPKLVKKTPSHLRGQVANNLNAVANSRGGRYVLVDYVNFKGEGLNRTGGYKGQNWGLLQVLEEMRPVNPGQQALNEFADASMRVLERRVKNSNPSRNERKWLPGWRNRTNTYRNPI
ncbi:hypothetical protein [uncultured Cocleimonas sp.]|uniref:hypothetical protein n=1 Tax=uncultured Cocleimonas sp. TaxID=1051587 RepID=UPI002635ED51|nr:hypothetical protein [uncultured Cocleimonas sp.]